MTRPLRNIRLDGGKGPYYYLYFGGLTLVFETVSGKAGVKYDWRRISKDLIDDANK